MATSVFDFTMKNITGTETPLSTYKGKVSLIVNVASKCGLTPQYEALEKVYQAYKDQGLVVLGFPANNFGAQEPGTEEEIQTFCSTKYNVTFDMFSKISVKDADIHPLYTYLTSLPEPLGGEIEWNFGKFLVGKDGEVIARFSPKTAPDAPEVIAAIENALK
jgi:glutathione peroxidase